MFIYKINNSIKFHLFVQNNLYVENIFYENIFNEKYF